MSAIDVVKRCEEVGVHLTRQALSNVENGRRDDAGSRRRQVSAEELLGLAFALDVSPLHLLVPPRGNDRYAVTDSVTLHPANVRKWVRGTEPLPGQDRSIYFSEIPQSEIRVVPSSELGWWHEAEDSGEER